MTVTQLRAKIKASKRVEIPFPGKPGVTVSVVKSELLKLIEGEPKDAEFPASVRTEGTDFITTLG